MVVRSMQSHCNKSATPRSNTRPMLEQKILSSSQSVFEKASWNEQTYPIQRVQYIALDEGPSMLKLQVLFTML